jgi:rubrerythrin
MTEHKINWVCKKCGTGFEYHPKPCPICHDEPKINWKMLNEYADEIIKERKRKNK